MRATDLEGLATKLGRPPTGLSAFATLTPEQIGRLSELIDAARERRRRELATAFERAIPMPARAPLLAMLRRARR